MWVLLIYHYFTENRQTIFIWFNFLIKTKTSSSFGIVSLEYGCLPTSTCTTNTATDSYTCCNTDTCNNVTVSGTLRCNQGTGSGVTKADGCAACAVS